MDARGTQTNEQKDKVIDDYAPTLTLEIGYVLFVSRKGGRRGISIAVSVDVSIQERPITAACTVMLI